jgi:hypothetical protein
VTKAHGRERAWQDAILDALPSGVDPTQVAENLRLSPTERLERMRRFLMQLEEARDRGRRLPPAR